jgi:hypothetical protein
VLPRIAQPGGRWLINEKGAVAAAGLLGDAPPGFADRAHAILGDLGRTRERSTRALDHAAVADRHAG